ncbi:hypothetical protein M2139_000498 [Enterococcus sp. PF1-24]|uniref:DUF2877 domain-containing protein n=1 Tax=unclassified Enterococcus TaxID=2608891 RepID=UPI00247465D1|nr:MULTISPECIES: DUF2877 domain-containing protein [unclassified Enterococcus]MDH6363523.1 hypothetical protein [Enterococcus sp. PFB1-1]MDH6400617.1 hypothetical protein [Enterococcus sp. PF1-24]
MNDEVLISASLIPLQQFGKTGHIHSVFSHSFNIKIGQQLLHISSYQNYLSNFGIYLPRIVVENLLTKIEIGNFVKIKNDQLIIYTLAETLKISLIEGQAYSLKLPHLEISYEKLQQVLTALASFDLPTKIGLNIPTEIVEKLVSPQLLAETEIASVVDYLFGRGQGLTPSGDDILVAYLATLKVLQLTRGQQLSIYLQNRTNLQTTDISQAYLLGVLQEEVSLPVLKFFKSIQQEKTITEIIQAFKRILAIGHTSGKDLAYGSYLALQYAQNIRNLKTNKK